MRCSAQLEWFHDLEKQGARIKELDDRPQLHPDLELDFGAYFDLSGSRRLGMGTGPIPMSEIRAYCDMFGIDGFSQRRTFLRRMQAMDRVFLKWAEAQSAKQAGK